MNTDEDRKDALIRIVDALTLSVDVEITGRGYTVVHGVLAQEEVEEFLGDTRRLQRELPTVIANSTTIVKGFRRKGQAVPEVVDHDGRGGAEQCAGQAFPRRVERRFARIDNGEQHRQAIGVPADHDIASQCGHAARARRVALPGKRRSSRRRSTRWSASRRRTSLS